MPDAATSARMAPRLPTGRRQLLLLLGLWWRHMRRRATRPGDAPKLSGVPTFLLINLLSVAYMAPLVWRAVKTSMGVQQGFFAWHVAGVVLIALGSGVSKGASTLQLRAMRDDAFLEPLPLTLVARLGLQLCDGFFTMLLALVVPLAGLSAYGALQPSALAPMLLGLFAYVVFFVVGQSVVAWSRVLGPPLTARRSTYAGIGLHLIGLVGTLTPIGQLMRDGGALAAWLTGAWLERAHTVYGLYAALLLLMAAAYRALIAAERRGFDRIGVQQSAPRAAKGVQDRVTLEWRMMQRQGGRALLITFSVILLGSAWLLLFRSPNRVDSVLLLFFAGFTVYLGAIQTLAQAGRAARSDLLARPFLAALPLAPHEVLDGKARGLRKLLIPVLAMLAMIGGIGLWQGDSSLAYRMLLALLSLYVIVDGAVGVAFLSHGVGVVGVAGGQASSSFSTQLLMMPLLTTVMASNDWSATVSFIAVVAVTREARRAAKQSVRWLDDPDDALERETTVWRALLAATAFFAMQVLSLRLLELFAVPIGYMLAIAFGLAALLLALLTWRNGARFERPRFMPHKLWCWPLGAAAGGASGMLALWMASFLPQATDASAHAFSTGELIAVFCTTVVMAPLAEEYFFRGWLQKAIERDLPEAMKHWAFALGAVAFALAHIGSYGVPQLVLGLIAGALYAVGGGLWPGILAHAVHNGVVLLVGQ